MRQLALAVVTVVVSVLGSSGSLLAQNPSQPPAAAVYGPRTTVEVIDRGASPRRQLRYAWVVGQKEATQIDLSVATDMSRGLSTSGDVQVPTIRMIGTIEVIEERPDGTWVLEQVILEAGVPMGEADGIIAADVAEASVATLEGSAFRVRVDTRGNLYESETIPPPGLDPAQVDALQNTTNSLEGLLLVLPRQRVGQGAVWRVDESFDGEMGFSVKQIRRTKLVEVDGDRLLLKTTVRQLASDQRLDLPDAPQGLEMWVDSHQATGSGSALIDLGAVANEATQDLDSHTEFTARMGKQVESLIMDITIDSVMAPIALADLPEPRTSTPADALPAVRRHEVVEEDLAVSFPSHWAVGPTNRRDHAWLYPDEVTDDPAWYGILIASGDAQRCSVEDNSGWVALPPAWSTLEEVVAHELDWMGRDADLEKADSRYYSLPAGRVARIDMDWYSGLVETKYWFSNGSQFVELDCWSNDPPDDRWLSVARSFAFLTEPPATETLLTYVRAPRTPAQVSRPLSREPFDLAGLSLQLTPPQDWSVRVVSADHGDGLLGALDSADLPYQRPLLRLDHAATGAFCALTDITRLAERVGWSDSGPAGRVRRDEFERLAQYYDPQLRYVRLPAGPGALVSVISSDGRAYDEYIIDAHDAWLHLACWSPSAVDHRWRAVAESIAVPVSRNAAGGSDVPT